MPTAFVLVSCEIDSAELLAAELKKLPGVEYATRVSGVYDFIVKVNSEADEDLKRIALGIRTNNWVRSSSTLVVVKERL
jgi:DNA-binding Lrp family transcriptional regulator